MAATGVDFLSSSWEEVAGEEVAVADVWGA